MKNILLAGLVIIIFTAIGSATGNKSGGFIVGIVLAIMISKRLYKNSSNPPSEN